MTDCLDNLRGHVLATCHLNLAKAIHHYVHKVHDGFGCYPPRHPGLGAGVQSLSAKIRKVAIWILDQVQNDTFKGTSSWHTLSTSIMVA